MVFVEKKRIAGIAIDENDVGKSARLDRAGSTEAVNLLVFDVFGGRKFLEILYLGFQAVFGAGKNLVRAAGCVLRERVFTAVNVGRRPRALLARQ